MEWIKDRNPDKDGKYLIIHVGRGSDKPTYKLVDFTTDLKKATGESSGAGWYEWKDYEYVTFKSVDGWLEIPEFK